MPAAVLFQIVSSWNGRNDPAALAGLLALWLGPAAVAGTIAGLVARRSAASTFRAAGIGILAAVVLGLASLCIPPMMPVVPLIGAAVAVWVALRYE